MSRILFDVADDLGYKTGVQRKIYAIYATYIGVYFASFLTPQFQPAVREYGMLAIAIFPALLIAAQKLLYYRFWKAMAAAHIVWGIGQLVWIANRHGMSIPNAVQDSAYWLFKLLVLGAILYRPFYAASDAHRRLHWIDTTVALSIIAFYVGYFFIVPSLIGEHVAPVFHGTLANVFLNTGIAITTFIVAWKARLSPWKQSYWLIAAGLGLYTLTSLLFSLSGMSYTDPLWAGTFGVLALAVAAAPPRELKPVGEVLVPSRYGLALILITTVYSVHLIVPWISETSYRLHDLRSSLTLVEVVALTVLIHLRQKVMVHEAESRLHQLEVTVNSIRQPIYIVDGDYNVVIANDVFRNRFGFAGGFCYSRVFGRSSPCEWCELKNARQFSASVESGGWFYQLEFAPLSASGGVELLVDVTNERKRQQQAIQTERMAALGRMIAGTAHELNNPLAIILGNAHLLRDHQGLDNTGRRQIAAVASAAERARDIVHTFLTLSRPTEGDKELLDMAAVIRSVEHLKLAELESYGIELDIDLAASLTVLGKYTMLQEVFLNLIDNARDAIVETGRGKGLIIINGDVVPQDKVRIQISDNGVGIRRDDLYRVFDPFFSTKDVGKGTGLGLSLVHSIISDHNGRIQVDSDGSTFTRFDIELPYVTIPSSPCAAPPNAANVLRILAVDDEPDILDILQQSLGRMGHHVECTTTGTRALQLLARNKFDLLLLDMHLPEMDGRSIVKRLQAMIPPVSVRIVFVTGDTMNEETQRFAQEHGLLLIMKPVDMEKLRVLLEQTTPLLL